MKYSKQLVAAIAFSMAASIGSAATITRPCTAFQALGIPGAQCELGTDQGNPGQNNDSTARVNADAMFGLTGWTYLAKDNDLNGTDEGPFQAALDIDGTTLAGDWDIITATVSIFNQFMIVMKDGNGIPDTYIGYLVTSLSGTYATPFLNGRNPKNISHVSLYGRTVVSTVPVPAAGLLLLGALGALSLARRRKTV